MCQKTINLSLKINNNNNNNKKDKAKNYSKNPFLTAFREKVLVSKRFKKKKKPFGIFLVHVNEVTLISRIYE